MKHATSGPAAAACGLVGLAIALGAALHLPDRPPGTAAVVNGVPVIAPAGDDARRIEHAIDRELLIQRGLATDVPRLDRRVRALLVSAQIDAIVAEGLARDRRLTPEDALADWLRERVARTPVQLAPDLEPLWREGTYATRGAGAAAAAPGDARSDARTSRP